MKNSLEASLAKSRSLGTTGPAAALAALCAVCGCGAKNDTTTKPPITSWQFVETGLGKGNAWSHRPVHEDLGDVYDHGSGVAVGDIDGDGHEDIVLLNQCGAPGYFLGHGDGTFTDASSRLAMLGDGVRFGVTYGDYDNDGRVDLYVTFTRRPNALLHQNADGTFTDVAADKGVALTGHYSGAVFVDVNQDGYLDLLVAGNMRHTTEELVPADPDRQCPAFYRGLGFLAVLNTASDPSSLFINGGPDAGFNFADEAKARGIPMGGAGADTRGFSDATTVDLDGDGHPDLVMSEMFFGRAALLHNDGTGHFTEVTADANVRPSFGPATITAADYDNNGFPDLFMTDMHSDMWIRPEEPAESVVPGVRYKGGSGPPAGVGDNPTGPLYGNSLWMSTGGKTFQDGDLDWQAETFQPWGNIPADFNNDGNVDVFISSGMSNTYSYFPNMFLVNLGGQFQQMQDQVGFDPPPNKRVDPDLRVLGQPYVSSARTAAVGDFDENGTMDLVVVTWNNKVNVFRDDLPPGNHWLEVNLVGTAPRDPYGSVVEVKAGGQTLTRSMQGAGGYLSQSTRWVHFGLGPTDKIDSVKVKWTSGKTSSVDNPKVDTRVTVREP